MLTRKKEGKYNIGGSMIKWSRIYLFRRHYVGAIDVEVRAENRKHAEALAEECFNNINAEDFLDQLNPELEFEEIFDDEGNLL